MTTVLGTRNLVPSFRIIGHIAEVHLKLSGGQGYEGYMEGGGVPEERYRYYTFLLDSN